MLFAPEGTVTYTIDMHDSYRPEYDLDHTVPAATLSNNMKQPLDLRPNDTRATPPAASSHFIFEDGRCSILRTGRGGLAASLLLVLARV
jgi:hypothetical protein